MKKELVVLGIISLMSLGGMVYAAEADSKINIEQSNICIDAAKSFYENKDYANAEKKLNEALKLNNKNAEAYFRIGMIEDVVKNNKDINSFYIMGITKHKVKDYYRFKYKEKLIKLITKDKEDFYENIPSDFDLEKSISNKYDMKKVWDYLKGKNIIIFKVFYLYYVLDLSLKEISINLKISESNVKHYLYRTLKELNKYLESDGDKNA